MARNWNAGETPIPAGVVARAVAGFRNMWNQNTDKKPATFDPPFSPTVSTTVNWAIQLPQQDWFGPGQPLSPVAPATTAGRQWDFPSYSNIDVGQKKREGVDYATLIALANSYDLVGLLIDTRKDQICHLKWSVSYKDDEKKPDTKCKAITDFLAMPDREHSWQEWLRMLMDDMLVIDAATVFPRQTKGGGLYSLEPVDGSTIDRVIDNWGRTPLPPDPAYQQVLKGLPAVNYTREQLIYKPRNITTRRLFGISPVERIILTVQTALNRQLWQSQFYTDGSTPDLIMTVPSTWQSKQIQEFEQWWNGILSGNTKERRRTRFVPDGVNSINTKDGALTDPFDQWLARICCYCFGMSPQPFVATMNRATAETADQQSKEEGIGPHMAWVKSLMDCIIAHPLCFNSPDMEFTFEDSDETDPLKRAQIEDYRLRNGSKTLDEIRDDNGDDPLPDGMGKYPLIYTAQGAVLLKDVINPPATPDPLVPENPDNPPKEPPAAKVEDADELEKRKKKVDPTPAQIAELAKSVQSVLDAARKQVVGQWKVSKADGNDTDSWLTNLDLSAFGALIDPYTGQITQAAENAFTDVLVQVGADAEPVFGLANTRAEQIAADRAASLIGTDGNGGELSDATRLLIRGSIEEAFKEGWTPEQLASALETAYAFSADRAKVIAETELRMAMGQGAIEAARASGVVVGKQWLISSLSDVCVICLANEAEGVIGLDDTFLSGDDTVPAHPNCRCVCVFTTESST